MLDTLTDQPRTQSEKSRKWPLIAGGLVCLFLLTSMGLVYYWIDWRAARADRGDQTVGDFLKTYETFWEHVEADRLDEAYRMTTASFQALESRDAFAERMGRVLAFKRKADARGIEGNNSGPAGGDIRGPNRMIMSHTWEDKEGNRMKVTVTVIQEDSYFSRRPPSPQIEMVTVTSPRLLP